MSRDHTTPPGQRAVLLLLVALALLAPACGTLLYPDRHGQDGGDLDPTVVILDGIGVLFWVVPGLLAFLVDFYTGAIYEPGIDAAAPPLPLSPRAMESPAAG